MITGRTFPWTCVWVLLSFGCSGGGATKGSGSDAGGGGLDASGLNGGDSAANAADGGPDGGGSGEMPDMCGSSACADHTGSKSFVRDGVPQGASDSFTNAHENASGANATHEPAMVYPAHETMFPINVSRIRHEWSGADNDLFRLRFEGPKTTVDVYATDTNITPSEEEWDWIAESNRGASVTLTVTGLRQNAPAESWTSAPIKLFFSRSEVEGALYYWSTGSQGIMRAVVSDPIPQKFYTDPMAADSKTCVACHTLSRDGKRLAVGYGGETLREASVPERKRLVPTDETTKIPSAWTTFTPDAKGLLVAANGKLTLLDSDTDAPIGDNAGVVPLPNGKLGTHPDFHPKGDRIVLALGTKGGNKSIEGASIAVIPYLGAGKWGDATIVVQSAGGKDNNFFPVWSPDGKWIAYVNAQSQSKDATTAVLKLIPESGGTPIELTRLNKRVNASDGVTGIGNSMPTWAPSTRPGTFWVAFSSLRAYATLRPQDDKEDQIWIAAIDPTKTDPSYSAFWAPFQSIEEGNHRAFWTHTESDTQCLPFEVCGDGFDNDCNGVSDDSNCVTCGAEICGDKLDNDCDGVVDDCIETDCTDGMDNDLDGLTDDADTDCDLVVF